MTAPNILIVDDSAVIRHTIKKALQKRFSHFRLSVATHGLEAQQLIEHNRFQLILCDWEMPKMGGDELLIWIRQHPVHQQLPFVMVTSRTDATWVSKAARLGANNYLGKPFTSDSLAEMTTVELLKSGVPAETLKLSAAGVSNLSSDSLCGLDPLKTTGIYRSSDLVKHASCTTAPTSVLEHRNDLLKAAFRSSKQSAVKGLTVAQIRAGDQILRCLIETLGSRSASLTIPGGQDAPGLFEPIVFDTELPDQQVSTHLNAFVVGSGWFEPRPGVRLRRADLVFVDDDEGKLEQLRELRKTICVRDLRSRSTGQSGGESGFRSYDFSALSSGDSMVI